MLTGWRDEKLWLSSRILALSIMPAIILPQVKTYNWPLLSNLMGKILTYGNPWGIKYVSKFPLLCVIITQIQDRNLNQGSSEN
jgi:hypothetical protein